MQLPCKWQVHLYNLKTISLSRCWWRDVKSLCFPKLKVLEVKNSGRSALFTISGFRSLQQLQTLKISECALLEEIVEDVRGDEHAGTDTMTIKLFQLDSIILKDLPNLRSFAHGKIYECYMPALKKVEVDNCGLPSLFTSSVFRNLQHLETLVISKCRLLEGIINDERGDETSDTDDKIFILCQLSSVTLEDLPNLRSLCRSVSYAFNMPKLKSLHLLGCPQLENFTYLKTSTGLVSVYAERQEGEEVTDINDFVIQNHKRGSNLVTVLSNRELESDSGILKEEQPRGG